MDTDHTQPHRPTLAWASAATSEPGDQQADSRHPSPPAVRAYYQLGPAYAPPGPDGERWSLTLVEIDADGATTEVSLGTHPDEDSAKQHAQRHEDRDTTEPDSDPVGEEITGFGLAYDPGSGELRLAARLTAEFDVTLAAYDLHGILDIDQALADTDPDDPDEQHDALIDAVTSGDTLMALLTKATGHRRNGHQLDLDAALSCTVELDTNSPLDAVHD